LPALAFAYGAGGQRILKQVGDPALGTGHREHYIRDAQGNIMAVYKYTNNGTASTQLVERPVYGSSRLGSYAKPQEVMGSGLISNQHTAPLLAADQRYELTDHLGNVATVVTGRLLPGNGAGSAKQAEVVSAQGYEAFGSLLPGRNYSSGSYRWGFQGEWKDKEVFGVEGGSIAFKYRAHDTRRGQFWSIDPLAAKYPFYSPYAFSGNRVIDMIELEGLEPIKPPIGTQNTSWEIVSSGTAISLQRRLDAGETLSDERRPYRTEGKGPSGKQTVFYLQRPVLRVETYTETEMRPVQNTVTKQAKFAEGSGMFESEGFDGPNFGGFLKKHANDITGVNVQYVGPGSPKDGDTSWATDILTDYVKGAMGIELKNVTTAPPLYTGDTGTGESYGYRITFDYKVTTTDLVPVEVEKSREVRDYGPMPE
jgi:hypothetical protein